MRRSLIIRLAVGVTLVGVAGVLAFERTRYAQELTVDGVARTYEVVVVGDPHAGPLPLVFVFHGRDRTSWNIRRRFGLDAAARALGDRGVFVYPQALELPGSRAVAWQAGCAAPDLRFVDELLRALSGTYAIDRARIFATGMSWGGEMAIAVGCCRPDVVRAVAPLAGGTWDSVSAGCSAQVPALRISLGEEDRLAPPAVLHHVADEFRARQHCSNRSHPAGDHCLAADGCEAPVIECSYPGLGHELPPGAGREVWAFFRSFENP
jgi:polyhydroxybutyrate depolymerase